MSTISLKRARETLGELVAAAEEGETTFITRRGKKAAVLGPVLAEGPKRLPDLTQFRASIQVTGDGLSGTVRALREDERH